MIPIKNIYYMLCYAFQVLKQDKYRTCATENFDNVWDLFSEILINGITGLLKSGIGKEYILTKDLLNNPKGKFYISESVKTFSFQKKQVICEYDEFSVNSYMNQILKTTCNILMKSDIQKQRKINLKKLMIYFGDVDLLNLHTINWHITFNRNNQTYKMLIYICWLVVKEMLISTQQGSSKIKNFIDEQRMCRLYEKFILEYYKQEFRNLKVSSSQIKWDLDDDNDLFLPQMLSDVLIEKDDNILIIDAKYYNRTMQKQYDKHTIHSNNLYQIFAYVKNQNACGKHVSGMLLYAKTNENIVPNNTYSISGNKISVQTLDLNCDFNEIKQQLNSIISDYFNI